MTHLSLPPNCTIEPRLIDIAVIETMMLWPDDAHQRQRVLSLMHLEILQNLEPVHVSNEHIKNILKIAVRAPAREDIKAAWEKRSHQGMVAGMILYSAVQFSQLKKKPVSLAEINKFVVNEFKTKIKDWRIRLEPQTIKNDIWPRFRSVAHLWAASRWYIFPDKPEEMEHTLDLSRPFVCPRSEFGRFLGISNSFCKQGEELRAMRAASPILRKGESIRAPVDVDVPEIDVRFFPHRTH